MAEKRRKVHCASAGIQGSGIIHGMIPQEKYIKTIETIPILCVDLVIQNMARQYLLVKRNNEPLKDEWWVVGGRVLKGETIIQAGIRKAKQELGSDLSNIQPIGFFEAPFQKHPFGKEIDYHAVSIVLSAGVDEGQNINMDSQSSEWKFSDTLPTSFKIQSFNAI